MKLSEAIRKGAAMHPQSFGRYTDLSGEECRTCAMGAAFEGVTGELPFSDGYGEKYPNGILGTVLEACGMRELEVIVDLPLDADTHIDDKHTYITSAIIQLNDVARWSREQIADWVETLGL